MAIPATASTIRGIHNGTAVMFALRTHATYHDTTKKTYTFLDFFSKYGIVCILNKQQLPCHDTRAFRGLPGRAPRGHQRPSGPLPSPRGRAGALHARGGEGRETRRVEDGGGTFAEE